MPTRPAVRRVKVGMRKLLWAGLVGALLVSGCARGPDEPAQPAASEVARQVRIASAGVDCVSDENQEKLVQYSADGLAYATGQGDTAVVFLHQADGGLCQWTPFADLLGVHGMRGFAIDIKNPTRVEDTVAAVEYLRSQGAKKVYLVGASMGGTTALSAAAKTPVDGVISLSGPSYYSGMDAVTAVKSLSIPVLFAAGEYDDSFADSAKELYAACASKQKRLILLSSGSHGVSLLSSGMNDAYEAFLADPAAAVAATS
jgi:pimeloyl-ACP methyl ester carboxylesterase